MKIHTFKQGSDAWHIFRLTHFGASEAAAMLGLSSKVKRNELLHIKYTMQPKEYSDWVENVLFADGHKAEELARPIIEEMIDDDLFPLTCSDGNLSASCDGLTLDGSIAFEHKIYNSQLAQSVGDGLIPDEYMPQCQQVLMVTGAKKLIFVASDGTSYNLAKTDVYPQKDWFLKIQAGWEQFAKDLAEYQPRELAGKPEPDAIMQLPALSIKIKGEVIASNLPAFKAEAEAFIKNINTDLKTDNDFCNAEATVKYCDETEKKLEAAKKAAIAQTASIDEVMRTIDFIKDQIRAKRLDLDKQVKVQKSNIKTKILNDGEELFNVFIRELADGISPIRLMVERPNFASVMKNKRTLESLHNSVDTEIARCKILANEVKIDIRKKLDWYENNIGVSGPLVPDLQDVIYKPFDDFLLLVNTRMKDEQIRIEEAAKKKIEEAAKKKIEDDKAEVERLKQKTIDDAANDDRSKETPLNLPIEESQLLDSASKTVTEHRGEIKQATSPHRERIKQEAIQSGIDAGMPTNEANKMVEIIACGIIKHITINY